MRSRQRHRAPGRVAAEPGRTPSRRSWPPSSMGAAGIELDVRRTADGVLVVHHDAALPDGRAIDRHAGGRAARARPDVRRRARRLRRRLGQHRDQERPGRARLTTRTSRWPPASSAELARRPEPNQLDDLVVPARPRRSLPAARPGPGDGLPGARGRTTPRIAGAVDGGHRRSTRGSPTVDGRRRRPLPRPPGWPSTRGRATTRHGAVELAAWGVDGICTDVPDDPAALRHPRPPPTASILTIRPVPKMRALARILAREFGVPYDVARAAGHRAAEDEADGVGDVVELQAVDLAEVVAVELVRERRVVLDDEVVEVDLLASVAVGFTPPPRRAPATPRSSARGLHRAERDGDQPAIERGGVRQVEGAVAEVRVRVGVEHDREVAVLDDLAGR